VSANELKRAAEQAVAGAAKRGVEDSRAVASRSRSVSVTYRLGRPDKVQESQQRSLTLHLYEDGRYSVSTTNDLRPRALEKFFDNAAALTRAMTPDPFRVMPDPSLYAGRRDADLGLYDVAMAGVVPADRTAYAAEMEAAALEKAGARAVSAEATYEDEESELHQIHSNGFEGSKRATDFWASAEVSLRDDGDKRPEGWSTAGTRRRSELKGARDVGREAAEDGLRRLGARKMETARLPMIVENRAVGRLLGYLMSAASGRALQQKRSFLEGKAGRKVGGDLLTLTDDPFVPGGFGSRLFDGEGISAKVMPVFERGVFRNFYVDVYYGRKLGMPPTTGGSSNLVLAPGTKSLEELARDIDRGILVRGFIGGNSNSTTGDFSLGVYGTLVEKGVLARAVSEMNVAGNHLEFWKLLAAVGNDPWPYSAVRAPSLVFDGVQFSGE
jgi:PmbA protein